VTWLKSSVKRALVWGLLVLARVLSSGLRYAEDTEPFFQTFSRHGFYLLPRHYYLPIPDSDDIRRVHGSELVGLAMRDESQRAFTNDVILKYKAEVASLPSRPSGRPDQFYLLNGGFMAGDAHAYYSLIRELMPRTVIEIGSGNSTLLANSAITMNLAARPEYRCKLIAIEPFPPDYLAHLKNLHELKQCKLQDVSPDYFAQLKSGDILFIDSSHVLKSGGDVWLEYCEIIPRLNSGVYVHVHDISLPKPYPSVYYDTHLYWNEQYVLQALLTNNDKLEVVWAGTYLFDKYPEEMTAAFSPEFELMREAYPLAEPSSFWLRVK